MKKLTSIAILAAMSFGTAAVAQETSDNGLNALSLRPIHDSNVAYKTTLWRRLDLNEKQNQPLFAKGYEITKHLIEGVKAGILDAYAEEDLLERLTLEEFNERLFKKFEGGGLSKEEIEAGFGNEEASGDDGWGGGGGGDDGWGGGSEAKPKDSSQSGSIFGTENTAASREDGYELFANELYIIEFKEDWIFDRQRSRQYFDIQTITIKIPAEVTGNGLEKTLASFKYKELDQFFRNKKDAIWYNSANTAKHLNLADALELRLFHGRIVKKANEMDKFLDQQYKNPKEALFKSQELEYELLEFEHNFWEY
ncbi:gliding motility associated protien GldN [Spirosomataceae bacterium TFI 002]|nr:gliding motility associated protien GldN [Spirosomataceae bacterium TFI 002]